MLWAASCRRVAGVAGRTKSAGAGRAPQATAASRSRRAEAAATGRRRRPGARWASAAADADGAGGPGQGRHAQGQGRQDRQPEQGRQTPRMRSGISSRGAGCGTRHAEQERFDSAFANSAISDSHRHTARGSQEHRQPEDHRQGVELHQPVLQRPERVAQRTAAGRRPAAPASRTAVELPRQHAPAASAAARTGACRARPRTACCATAWYSAAGAGGRRLGRAAACRTPATPTPTPTRATAPLTP